MTVDRAAVHETIVESLPPIETISNDELREGTVEAWTLALIENDLDDLRDVQWYPTRQRELGLGDELLVDHVLDVAALSVEMTDRLVDRRDVDLSLDLVITGALVHDVSKVYEFSGYESTPINDLLGHPYYGIASVAKAELPAEVAHIVLSHSPLTSVEPATLEALIVRCADTVAAAGIKTDESELRGM